MVAQAKLPLRTAQTWHMCIMQVHYQCHLIFLLKNKSLLNGAHMQWMVSLTSMMTKYPSVVESLPNENWIHVLHYSAFSEFSSNINRTFTLISFNNVTFHWFLFLQPNFYVAENYLLAGKPLAHRLQYKFTSWLINFWFKFNIDTRKKALQRK